MAKTKSELQKINEEISSIDLKDYFNDDDIKEMKRGKKTRAINDVELYTDIAATLLNRNAESGKAITVKILPSVAEQLESLLQSNQLILKQDIINSALIQFLKKYE